MLYLVFVFPIYLMSPLKFSFHLVIKHFDWWTSTNLLKIAKVNFIVYTTLTPKYHYFPHTYLDPQMSEWFANQRGNIRPKSKLLTIFGVLFLSLTNRSDILGSRSKVCGKKWLSRRQSHIQFILTNIQTSKILNV